MFKLERYWQIVQKDDYVEDKNGKVWRVLEIEKMLKQPFDITKVVLIDRDGVTHEMAKVPGNGQKVSLWFATEEEAMATLKKLMGAIVEHTGPIPVGPPQVTLEAFNPRPRSKTSMTFARAHLELHHGVAMPGAKYTPEELHAAHDDAHARADARQMIPHDHKEK